MGIQFPLGTDNFAEIRQLENYYIDKTAFIKELLSESFKVNLITRPPRFGKTLTMSMLEDFFDIRRDSMEDFQGLAISKDEELCSKWMNQWPTIYVTLKSIEGNDFKGAYNRFRTLISRLCKQFAFLETSDRIDSDDKVLFKQLKAQTSDDANLNECLCTLMRMLYDHYGKQVILLIDEYDVPLAKASDHNYYPQMLDVLRTLFR